MVYIYGYNVFHRPHPVFSSIPYVHISEMLCCARFPAVVHVSQKLCMCHRSCARFTSPLITFVFNCIHTERILVSKSIGATKHVLPIYIYIYHIYLSIYLYIYGWVSQCIIIDHGFVLDWFMHWGPYGGYLTFGRWD